MDFSLLMYIAIFLIIIYLIFKIIKKIITAIIVVVLLCVAVFFGVHFLIKLDIQNMVGEEQFDVTLVYAQDEEYLLGVKVIYENLTLVENSTHEVSSSDLNSFSSRFRASRKLPSSN